MSSTAELIPALPAQMSGGRRLMVIRQDHETRRFEVVGDLTVTADGYAFAYRGSDGDGDFLPVPGFPVRDRTYVSDELFPFFANRVMSPRRPDYTDLLDAVGLTPDEATPVEMLVRTAGRRATDTYQIVPHPTVHEDGTEERLFLVSGIRHRPGAAERVAGLITGQQLMLRPEPDNPHDPMAILLDDESQTSIGWVPGYLCPYVHGHQRAGASVEVRVVQANGPEVPRHLQLLCRMDVVPATDTR